MLTNCHSYFSFRYGTIPEKELLALAAAHGYATMALTDVNNTSACLNFLRLAPGYGIKPVVGIDFRNGVRQQYVGIARNNDGFRELNEFLSGHLRTGKAFPDTAPVFENAAILYPFRHVLSAGKKHFGPHEYIGVALQDLLKPAFHAWTSYQDRMVLLHTVTFRHQRDFNMHRLLRAIAGNTLLSKLTTEETAGLSDRIIPLSELEDACREYPFLIRNTEKLLDECNVYFGFGAKRSNQNRKLYKGSEEEDIALLRQLCEKGLSGRYDAVTDPIRQRMEMELQTIRQMNFVPFFLYNRDIVEYARRKNYYYVGRGSGANSIVAYLLRITNVDPVELDLYFERFINLYRASPPDFDLDFSPPDREDITRYIFEKFGRHGQVALLGSYNTFQFNAAVRELGKVMGLPPDEIENLGSGKATDKISSLVVKYATYMQQEELPNHLSIHAGGILISEQPVTYFSAVSVPPKGYPTTQFDMLIAEDVGLTKFDILGQRGLAKIKETLGIIRYNRPEVSSIDIDNVREFMRDPKVNELIRKAECIGCFYVESPAMRMLLKKLEVTNYLGLVAASSIIRPGVAKSGMMREYILRHRDSEKRSEPHPLLRELMKETYGVMVYQEDVIKVAHYFGGLTLAEADVLRRGMSGKFRSREEFGEVRERFFSNCRQNNIPEKSIEEIWRQMESFAGYAFAKGHSASYAVESYQTLFLKTYFPLEFMVAVLNCGGGFYGTELYVHEARLSGGIIHAPCINRSSGETVISGKDIYLGMGLVGSLEGKVIRELLDQRRTRGVFGSLEDFMERVPVSVGQVSILIRIGAFRFTGLDRRALLWKAHYYLAGSGGAPPAQQALFKRSPGSFQLPAFNTTPAEDAFEQIELLGFPLCSPFDLLLNPPEEYRLARDMKGCTGFQMTLYGYLVTVKSTRTGTGERMFFGTFTDYSGAFIDTVHFPPVAKAYPFRGNGVYKISGKVADEFGFLTLEVSSMEKQAYIQDPRYADT